MPKKKGCRPQPLIGLFLFFEVDRTGVKSGTKTLAGNHAMKETNNKGLFCSAGNNHFGKQKRVNGSDLTSESIRRKVFSSAIRAGPNTSTNVFSSFTSLSLNESRLKALESHFLITNVSPEKVFLGFYAIEKFMFDEIRGDDAERNNKPFNLMF